MLVQVSAVEHPQAVAVAREVGGHPIQDHANAVLVAMIDQIHEVLRRAVTAGDGKVPYCLIAPTSRERMLADGEQLKVRVAHLLAVFDKLIGQLAIRQPASGVVARAAPAPQVDFVDRLRGRECIVASSICHPLRVVPMVTVEIGHARCRPRRQLGRKPIGVGLFQHLVAVPHAVLIDRAFAQAGHEQFPHAAGNVLAHRVAARIPGIEVADHADARGIRGPHGEVDPLHAIDRTQLGAELVVAVPMLPLAEQVEVEVA